MDSVSPDAHVRDLHPHIQSMKEVYRMKQRTRPSDVPALVGIGVVSESRIYIYIYIYIERRGGGSMLLLANCTCSYR